MWKKIDQYVEQHHMIEKGDRILVGLSGGADSVLLTRYLLHLRDREGIQLFAVHVNHLLRGEEAFRDEDFVKRFCEKWEIPCFIFQKEVASYGKKHKMSLEEAGREIRYTCFREILEREKGNKIAIAHHAGDLVETMIFRMIRGTGPEGLCAIQPMKDNRIRPLLCVDKEEILWMLKVLEEDYVDDSTNKELDYSRNYIRHQILPAMAEINGKAIDHMSRLSEQLKEQTEYISGQMEELFRKHALMDDGNIGMKINFLNRCSSFEQKEMIKRMIFLAGGHRKDIAAIHISLVQDLLEKADGRKYDLPYGLLAVREREFLWIGKQKESTPTPIYKMEVPIDRDMLEEKGEVTLSVEDGKEVHFTLMNLNYEKIEQLLKNDCMKYFDYDKINSTLLLRNRRNGDYFVMDASGRHKKLNRYFIDQKIPEQDRDRILLLAQENHILWIEGGRVSQHFKIDKTTKRVLRLSLE